MPLRRSAHGRRRLLGLLLALVTGAGVLAAGSAPGPVDRPGITCEVLDCRPLPDGTVEGTLDGLSYALRLPARWNGVLLVWSHGYRRVGTDPLPAQLAPDRATADALAAQGYALAGSAWSSDGWAVPQAVAAAVRLRDWFAAEVAQPVRTVAWGVSLGGLVSVLLAERHPDRFAGAAPACATLGGPVRKVDLGVDVLTAVRALLDPTLPLATTGDPAAVFRRAAAALDAADRATVTLLAALVDAPSRDRYQDGATPESATAARRTALRQALAAGTWQRAEIGARFGGEVAGTVGVEYAARVDTAERAAVEALTPGLVADALARLDRTVRVQPDPPARARALREGTPTGHLAVPVVALHTLADERVPAQHAVAYRAAVREAGRSDLLLQLWTDAPATYPARPGSASGAGHCRFTPAQRLAQVALIDGWLASGLRPGPIDVAALTGAPGFTTGESVAPWPGTAADAPDADQGTAGGRGSTGAFVDSPA